MVLQTNIRPVWLSIFWFSAMGCSSVVNDAANSTQPADTIRFPALVRSSDLKTTDVRPHPDGEITAGRNYVYCATFQLAWNEMQDKIVKGAIELEDAPAMVESLNRQAFRRADLSDDSYLALAGTVKEGIVEQLRQALREKFPSAAMQVPDPASDSVIYAYAYLQKALAFKEAFDRLEKPLEFQTGGKTTRVVSFGIEKNSPSNDRDLLLLEQVTILDYKNDDDFILRLNSTSKRDEIVLAKISPKPSLRETIDEVQQRIAQSTIEEYNRELRDGESLIVPIVALNVERTYSKLTDKHFKNAGWTGYYVTEARQGIRFRLDETGARLESDASFADASKPPPPRHFVFNKPFLVYLKEKTSDVPYLAIWIETPEVLTPETD